MFISAKRLESWKNTFKNTFLFGNEPTPELFAILMVYFVQGILGLSRLAVSFFLKDELALNPAQVGALTGIAALPWVIKPVFGLLSDSLPIFGYRRRPYLVLSGIVGSLAWLALGMMVNNVYAVTIILLLTSLSVAVSDVIIDSQVVERARKESLSQSGSLQSLAWGISAIGGLMTAYLSGLLLQHLSNRNVFQITAIFPLFVCFVAGLITEERVQQPELGGGKTGISPQVSEQIRQLWGAITQKSILLPMSFIFLWQATPKSDSAFFFFTTNELGFEPEFLGRVVLVTSLAALVGIWIYQIFLKTVPFRVIFGWSIVISSLLGMTALILVTHTNRLLGIDDHWFSLGDSLILTVMGKIAFMPLLVLSARLCPAGIEATMFALLMSVLNLSGLLSNELGALLTHWLGITETNFEHLWLLVVIANLSTLLPLPFIFWLPPGDPNTLEDESYSRHSLPPIEVFEHHALGSVAEQSFLPEIAPEFITLPASKEQ